MFGFSGVGIGMSVYLRDHFSQNAARINGQMLQMYGNAKNLQRGLQDNFEGLALVGGAVFGAGVLAAKGIASMVKTGMEFNKIMDAVGAVSEANTKQMEAMRNQALELGKTTIFSVREVGTAMEDLAKAGFNSDQIIGSIEGVTHLASAADFGLLQSADILNNVMQIFSKGPGDSEHVADLLTYAVNKSNINMDDMFEALKYFGDVATDLNIPLEDSLALIMKLGNAGIKGSIAGTSLGNMMRYLTKAATPFATTRQKEGLAMLGLTGDSFVGANGNLKAVTEMVDILMAASSKLNTIEKQAAFEAIFGVRGKRGVSPLMRMSEIGDSVQGYSDSLKSNDVFGMAEKVSGQKLDNLAGDLKKLSAAWEVLSVQFTTKLEPFLRGFTQGITAIVNGISWIIDSPIGGILSAAVVALTGWAIAWGGIRLVVGLFGNMFLTSTATFRTMGQTLSMTLNGVMGQLFGINQGLRGVGINANGRAYVQRGQTIVHNGRTYRGGQLLPQGYVGGTNTGRRMGMGMGRGLTGLFGGGSGMASGMSGIFNVMKGGMGRIFGSLFSMVGGWWGVGLALVGGLVFDFKGTINMLGDIFSGLGEMVIKVIEALNPFTMMETGLDWLGNQLNPDTMDRNQNFIATNGVFNRDAYMAAASGEGDGSTNRWDYRSGGSGTSERTGKKVIHNSIYIDGKLQMMQTLDDEAEQDLFNNLGY